MTDDVVIHDMQVELVEPSSIKLHPENYNEGDADAIAQSMSDVGIYRPIYVQRSTGHIIGGNTTYLAELQHGVERIPVIMLDVDDEDARRILVGDNLLARLGRHDLQRLADVISALADTDRKLRGLGVTDELLAQLDTISALEDVPDDDDAADDERKATIGKSFDIFDRETVSAAAFDHYLGAYPYRELELHEMMQEVNALAALPDHRLRSTTLGYAVADTYHRHRLSARAADMVSPVDAIADPAKLRHGLDMIIDQGSAVTDAAVRTVCNFVHGAQACANFRPGFALAMYRKYCPPDAVVLDTSTGYGGRLIGFLASHCGAYVGIDPNTQTHAANEALARDLGAAERVALLCEPAEDVDADRLPKCDFAFTSPPYFAKEHYSDEPTQSYLRYRTGEEWRRGFLDRMIELQFAALKPGAYNVINIADVMIKRESYLLTDWTQESARRAGFEWVEWDWFALGHKRVPGSGEAREAVEPLLIFRKPA